MLKRNGKGICFTEADSFRSEVGRLMSRIFGQIAFRGREVGHKPGRAARRVPCRGLYNGAEITSDFDGIIILQLTRTTISHPKEFGSVIQTIRRPRPAMNQIRAECSLP